MLTASYYATFPQHHIEREADFRRIRLLRDAELAAERRREQKERR